LARGISRKFKGKGGFKFLHISRVIFWGLSIFVSKTLFNFNFNSIYGLGWTWPPKLFPGYAPECCLSWAQPGERVRWVRTPLEKFFTWKIFFWTMIFLLKIFPIPFRSSTFLVNHSCTFRINKKYNNLSIITKKIFGPP